MRERRRFVRIPENSQISYKVLPVTRGADFITRDIGEGGIRFFVREFIPQNSLLKIRLTIEKVTFSFEAIVRLVWIREDPLNQRYEVGVEFINIPQEAKEHLIKYIRNILKITDNS